MFGSFPASSLPPKSSISHGHPVKPKRSQVARACDWCRLHRVKCDTHRPCRNCSARGWRCSKSENSDQNRNLLSAIREIDKLKMRVKELEAQLERPHEANLPSESTLCCNEDGIHLDTALIAQPSSAASPYTQFYGPSSTYYFIHRINSYLATLGQAFPDPPHSLIPNSASRSFAHAVCPQRTELQGVVNSEPVHNASGTFGNHQNPTEHFISGKGLTFLQEAFFLDLFWDSWHCCYQILDENEFKAHYKSLWSDSAHSTRNPSALVDIVLALCMQFGVTSLPRQVESQAQIDLRDATIAGRWLYQRCQSLLAYELESPSLTTLQCQFWSAVYLGNASYQNMAQNMLGAAVRTAYALGLHTQQAVELPPKHQEARQRMWWTLFVFETRVCIRLGRPWSIQVSQTTCFLPTEGQKVCANEVTWLSYTIYKSRLMKIARGTYDTFYKKCASMKHAGSNALESQNREPYLEACFKTLATGIEDMHAWVDTLPSTLKTKRHGPGEPFSTDLSKLEIDPFAPIWLRRQCLMLELQYHDLILTICRSCIAFPPVPTIGSTESKPHDSQQGNLPSFSTNTLHMCESAALHAISVTHLLHQVYKDHDILDGWYEPFNYQWNAAITLVGFVLAYKSESAVTPVAYDALIRSIEVVERMGSFFGVAASAALVIKGLFDKAKNVARSLETEQKDTIEADNDRSRNIPDVDLAQEVGAHSADEDAEAVSYHVFSETTGTMEWTSEMEELFGFNHSAFPLIDIGQPIFDDINNWE